MKNKAIWMGVIIGGILSVILFPTLSILEDVGTCSLHAFENQYVSDEFLGHFPTGDKTRCERALEEGSITGDGQVFGGHLVCYDNTIYETRWKCITPILYYPIYSIIQSFTHVCGGGGILIIIPLFILVIYGAIIGFIIGAMSNWIVVRIKKK